MKLIIIFVFIYAILALSFGIYCLVDSSRKIRTANLKQDTDQAWNF